jgi:hypothetical protein
VSTRVTAKTASAALVADEADRLKIPIAALHRI